MKRSLQRRLSLMLGGAILLSGLVAAAASFVLAYAEAREFQDDMLRQIGLLATRNSGVRGVPLEDKRAELALGDPESRINVFRLPGDPRPAWLGADMTSGFRTIEADGERLRLFVHADGPGTATVVTQPTETRDEIALDSALRTLVPLLLFLPVMVWLIVRIVRGELAPVGDLAGHLDAQPADRPRPLSAEGVPDEITPFVLAINRLLTRIGELLEHQRRFIADAAHELRSPLTALSIQAQNLEQAESPDAMRERIVPLRAGIERARRLAEQLLSLARTQTETAEVTAVDVSAMARELIAEYLPLAHAKGIDLGLDEAAPLTLAAAREPLRRLLRNALDNALKYAPEGGDVTLILHGDGDDAVIEIVDNGPGIPAAERDRVVGPFYRMPGASGEGSGLGLAIAKEAAACLGGSISLHERKDASGLVFRYRQRR